MKRREFIKAGLLTAASLASAQACSIGKAGNPMARQAEGKGGMPMRPFGKSGDKISIVGLGGIVVKDTAPEDAGRIVGEAFERGVNYFDVAPSYGNAQEILGPALAPYRSNVFLACKTGQRTRAGAEEEMKRSLEFLKTDHFDLYQLHAISDVAKDVEAVFAQGGAMEAIMQAKKEGRIRFVGFSAHTEEAALAAMDRYDFDSVLFPLNFAAWFKGGFGSKILTKAKEKGVSRLALKGMARQQWAQGDPNRPNYKKCWYEPLTDLAQAEVALRFTLSQPITAAIPPGDASLFRMAMDIAERFRPVTEKEIALLQASAQTLNPIFKAA